MTNLHALKSSNSGFTLIELIITVAIATILMTLAVPSFSLMINNNKVTSVTNEFVSSLNLARSEALKRSNNVSVCMSNTNYNNCVLNFTLFSYAENGWLVFSDCNGNGMVDTTVAAAACSDGGVDTIIKVGEANDVVDITFALSKITYNLSGRVDLNNPVFTVETTGSNTSIKKNKIKVNRIGRVKTCRVGNTGC